MSAKTTIAAVNPDPTRTTDQSQPRTWAFAAGLTRREARRRAELTAAVIAVEQSSSMPPSTIRPMLRIRLSQNVRCRGTPQARFSAFSTNVNTQVEVQPRSTRQDMRRGGEGSDNPVSDAADPGNTAEIRVIIQP